jgi:glycine/D-amino acid oxidase-like deaminating enzyme
MTMDQNRFDVVVVGGGIVGSTAAFCLARRGQTVALVERDRIGGGTTGSSFAWINATSKVADEAYHRLNAMGAALYRELAVEFGEARLGLHPSGMLQCVSRNDATGHKAMREQAERLQRYGYPNCILGAKELTALEPHIPFGDDTEALFAMADDWLDAPLFARFLASELRSMGAQVIEGCAAKELEMTDDGTITGVVTAQGTLNAPKVLVTVGPDTPEVLSELTGYDAFAARFPMTRVPGLLVTTPSTAPSQLLRHILYVDSPVDALHLRPVARTDERGRGQAPAARQGPDPRLRWGGLPRRLRAGHRNPGLPARRQDPGRRLAGCRRLLPRRDPQRRHPGPGARPADGRDHRRRRGARAAPAVLPGALPGLRLTAFSRPVGAATKGRAHETNRGAATRKSKEEAPGPGLSSGTFQKGRQGGFG